MKAKKYLPAIFILSFLFLNISNYSQNHNYNTTSTEIDTLYYLPDSASFLSQYSTAGEIYNVFTKFGAPNNWTSFKIKEIQFLFSEMVKGDTLKEVKFFKDTLKTLIYSQLVNEVLDSMDIYPSWYKLSTDKNMPSIIGSVEIPVNLINLFSLCITNQSFLSGNTFGFYESTQNWGITFDYPIKLVIERTTTGLVEEHNHIKNYSLSQNYPNPFNPVSTINYSTPKMALIIIRIYDVLGNQITTLVNEVKPAGNYKVNFNASNLSSGIYFYRMQSGNFIESKKCIVLK